jgi:hypothetical protein
MAAGPDESFSICDRFGLAGIVVAPPWSPVLRFGKVMRQNNAAAQ